MRRTNIVKLPRVGAFAPNMVSYARASREFNWADARGQVDGLPHGRGLNIAHEAVDRHADGPRGESVALLWLGKRGQTQELTYSALRLETNRSRTRSERSGSGRAKNGSVFSPLFSAFGPEPIRARIGSGEGRVLVTTRTLYEKKVAPVRDRLPSLTHVLLVPEEGDVAWTIAGTLDYRALLAEASASFEIPPTAPEDPALLHFTSGTTGKPKGAVHVHGAVIAHHVTGRLALDLHPDDIFWCTAEGRATERGPASQATWRATGIHDQAGEPEKPQQ